MLQKEENGLIMKMFIVNSHVTGCFVIVITVKIEEAIYDNTLKKITIRKISRWCKVQIK